MISNRPSKIYPQVLPWIRKVKEDLPEGGKLGAAGFCWGGYLSTHLCTEVVSPSSSNPNAQPQHLIDAQFTAHPSALAAPTDIIDAVKSGVPYSLALGTKDMVLAASKVDEAEATLRQDPKHDDYVYEFKMYQDMLHGFSVRGDASDKVVQEAMERAKTQAIEWFKKHL
ncbi:putative dienelactone hydrolase family protein [Phaeomoniella chlamydospora]|uniref:Putative dienelactone hydrolase family protein n=1 Tax=Phaeomoniella chlamydospora TaxID=158046 RepID=A0A0G2ES76_PHACM|nr:putative dienelactone hydrolase family protein [Phaeomoniella chlamydospora]